MNNLKKPFIIAEMSGNHNHSLDRALNIVEEVAKTGCSALKIQTYTADTMTLNVDSDDFMINNKKSLWHGSTLYDLYKKAYTPWEWHKPIFDKCKELGIIGFSTPFDDTSVDFLESLNVPMYKIASFEITHIPLLKKVASTKKTVIMSTGMASEEEIREALLVLKNNGCPQVILLKCTSSYPASPESSNLLTIPDMKQKFNCEVGLSDHTLGFGVSVVSIGLGASIFEKHFTLSRSEGGVDSAFSMEPKEMKVLVDEVNKAYLALGKITYETTEEEKQSIIFRRSIYVSKDIKAGEILSKDNIKVVRPSFGLEPSYYEAVLGRTIKKNCKAGTPLTFELLLNE